MSLKSGFERLEVRDVSDSRNSWPYRPTYATDSRTKPSIMARDMIQEVYQMELGRGKCPRATQGSSPPLGYKKRHTKLITLWVRRSANRPRCCQARWNYFSTGGVKVNMSKVSIFWPQSQILGGQLTPLTRTSRAPACGIHKTSDRLHLQLSVHYSRQTLNHSIMAMRIVFTWLVRH